MMQREIELLKICLKEIKKRHHPKGIPGLTRRWDEMLRRWDDASHHPKGILSMLFCRRTTLQKNEQKRNAERAQGTVGFCARDFVHGATAVKPKKVRS